MVAGGGGGLSGTRDPSPAAAGQSPRSQVPPAVAEQEGPQQHRESPRTPTGTRTAPGTLTPRVHPPPAQPPRRGHSAARGSSTAAPPTHTN